MAVITASEFWVRYKEELRLRGDWESYQSCKPWTKIAVAAARKVCTQLDLVTDCAFYLDVCGYKLRGVDPHDWDVRVAFEVENEADWRSELCKLAHIASELSVLMAYQLHKSWTAEQALDEYLGKMSDRLLRIPSRQWLFIFGPDYRNAADSWTAYTLDNCQKRVAGDEGTPLRGCDLMGIQ